MTYESFVPNYHGPRGDSYLERRVGLRRKLRRMLRGIPVGDLPRYYVTKRSSLLGQEKEADKIFLVGEDGYSEFTGRCEQVRGSSGCLVVDEQGRVFHASKHSHHGKGHFVTDAKPAGFWFALWNRRRLVRALVEDCMLKADHQGLPTELAL